ncbi:DNA repair protein RAD57 [Xylaria bambusicola]|uniref:DNA repair protein RAD57 n=1 Tax=Xylaria bambusicola TaxID=326684 RepID=UPI002008D276|nr:DNA repair protein RAD57 [Xylaria bambusicola]KAI0513159.1 DNA repair protein RAD57 [Xylaria bambusicola]
MTDLSQVLPDFPVAQYARLLPTIEKNQLTVTDLLTLELTEIGKRTQLPLLDVKRLCNAILAALHADLGVGAAEKDDENSEGKRNQNQNDSRPGKHASIGRASLRQSGTELLARPWHTISTLDASLDAALGGGVPTGYITEITGESGAGKTQFLLTLLLSVQLPPPHGLGRPALYISTEAALSTKRLSQILSQNPFFRALDADAPKPSLDRVISTVTPDLESQDHILTYQVPVEVSRRNIGLVVLDSVAANYRAEFERGSGGSNMAARSAELVRLGHLLRELARKHDLAVVVANQVADRFSSSSNPFASSFSPAVKSSGSTRPSVSHRNLGPMSQESPLASRSRNINTHPTSTLDAEPTSSMADIVVRSSMPEPPPEDAAPTAPAALALDHQQRWFTGWGDDPYSHHHETLKTPSLGLVWSTQIAARIALFRRPAYGRKVVVDGDGEQDGGENTTTYDDEYDVNESVGPYIKSWRRWMKIVFAPHVPGTGPGLEGAVEFEVVAGGLKGVERKKKGNKRGKV